MQRTVLISVLTATAISLALGMQVFKPATKPAPAMASSPMPEKSMPQSMGKILVQGNFITAEHSTQGEATIVVENGKRYLELSEQFRSDNGPDLFVLLHRQETPKDYKEANYVSLGRLQMLKGQQRYEIPEGVMLEEMKSAVIWCQRFNATFGYAMLIK